MASAQCKHEKQKVPTRLAREASVTEQYTFIHPIVCHSEMEPAPIVYLSGMQKLTAQIAADRAP